MTFLAQVFATVVVLLVLIVLATVIISGPSWPAFFALVVVVLVAGMLSGDL